MAESTSPTSPTSPTTPANAPLVCEWEGCGRTILRPSVDGAYFKLDELDPTGQFAVREGVPVALCAEHADALAEGADWRTSALVSDVIDGGAGAPERE